MNIYQVDPIADPRWAEFLKGHPRASVFHTPGWLETLHRAYRYETVVYTTSPPGSKLTNGLALSHIQSWLTGRRLVSLPFSDHSEPLVDSEADLHCLLGFLKGNLRREGWKYIEIRPLSISVNGQECFAKSVDYYFHKIDLSPPIETLFRSFHKSCIQRKIRRAEREALTYEEGSSELLLSKFYRLLLLTCHRKRLPPQPLDWFRHLIDCLGDALKIRVASKNGQPVASIITLNFKRSMVFKYGSCDATFNRLGGMQFLLWKAIEEAKHSGFHEFDLGRSDCYASGLVNFKDRWGSARSLISYVRYSAAPAQKKASADWKMRFAKPLFAYMPDNFLIAVGEMFYRHIG
jgi:hypothetical protein